MPNKNYLKGVRLERKIVSDAKRRGCIAFRSAGSHSPIDVIIINPNKNSIKFIQCKSGKQATTKKEIKSLLKKYCWMNDFFIASFTIVEKIDGKTQTHGNKKKEKLEITSS